MGVEGLYGQIHILEQETPKCHLEGAVHEGSTKNPLALCSPCPPPQPSGESVC